MSISRTLITFALIVIVFDGLWATVVRVSNNDNTLYASLWWVSLILYTATGFVVAHQANLLNGVLAATAVAAVDATLGWALSAAIGPGATSTPLSLGELLVASIFVALSGAVCGFVAALLSRLLWRRANA